MYSYGGLQGGLKGVSAGQSPALAGSGVLSHEIALQAVPTPSCRAIFMSGTVDNTDALHPNEASCGIMCL